MKARWSRASRACAWLLVVAACGHDAAPPKERAADLGGGVAARVGDEAIAASLVADVARTKGLTPREAMEGLVDDALAAQGSRAAGFDRDPAVDWPIVSAKARVTAIRLKSDSAAQGPPTDAEIDELTAQHWRQLDVPEVLRVIHAIALYPNSKKRTPEGDAAVRLTLDHIATAVAKATTPTEFEALARAVPAENKVQTRVESLAFTIDTTAFELDLDPSLPALADQTNTTGLTVQTNANSGYTLTVADNAAGLQSASTGNPTIAKVSTGKATSVAWPGAPKYGYTVTGTGASIDGAFSGGKYAGFVNAGEQVASRAGATGGTADTISVATRVAVDFSVQAAVYTDTITYTVTPNYA